MNPSLLLAHRTSATASRLRKGLRLIKELGAGLGLLLLANILVLGLVGVLKGSGLPKSVVNPLQLAYLPLMWAGLRFLKRKYQLVPAVGRLPLAQGAGRALLALLLVASMAAAVIALLHLHFGLGISFERLTSSSYKWLFMALMLGAAAAVEELLFRDYVLGSTLKVTSSFYLITGINAAAFLLLHIQGFLLGDYTLLWGLAIFAIGLCLSAYVLTFRELVFPVCFHAFWNISTTLYAENDKSFNLIKFELYPVHELLISDVTAAVCIAFCLSLFTWMAYRHRRVAAATA